MSSLSLTMFCGVFKRLHLLQTCKAKTLLCILEMASGNAQVRETKAQGIGPASDPVGDVSKTAHSSGCIFDLQPQSLAGLHIWVLNKEDS